MSWGCPHQISDFCKRLNRECRPGIKGCILSGRVTFLDSQKEVNAMGKVEVLDLSSIMPFERHEKIFQMWDALKSGETLKIINDHDPKPLRYQFEAEYKNQYEWEYEQEGPKDWIVKIKKITSENRAE